MATRPRMPTLSEQQVDALVAAEFSLAPSLIYLNHAAVAPWPQRTAQAVQRFAAENAQRGAANYPEWLRVEQRLRAQCAQLLGATVDDVAFQKNTSEALSVVAHGFPWRAGDNVIISDEEFPSNRIVWESLRPAGVTVRVVRLRGHADPERALMDAADARTRLLSISSVQYASGLRMDLARLGEFCHARGIAFCVDAIQGLGVIPHDIGAMRIDFLMADAHKWLLGPEGIAVFYVSPQWRDRLTLHQYGWRMVQDAGNYDRTDWEIAASARRFECGSPNMLGIHALDASLSLLHEIGLEHIGQRVRERADRIIHAVQRHPQLELITSAVPGRYAGIVTFRHRERGAAELHARLRERNVVCAARGGGIRFSPHYHNFMEQLDQAVAWAAV